MSNNTVLITMLPAYGHLNPTFPFAHRLSAEGFRVIYLASSSFQAHIAKQGFETVVIEEDTSQTTIMPDDTQLSKIDGFLYSQATHLLRSNARVASSVGDQFSEEVERIDPAIILLDSFTPYSYFFLAEHRKRCVILFQIMLSYQRRSGIAPLNSTLIPAKTNHLLNRARMRLSWWQYKLRMKTRKFLRIGEDRLSIIYQATPGSKKAIKRQLDFDRVFHPGIKGVEEIVIGPKALDFVELSPVRQLYLASAVGTYRNDTVLDATTQRWIDELQQTHQQKTWVYCSLGSISLSHNANCIEFFKQIIAVFKKRRTWNLLLAAGSVANHLGPQPSNIRVVGWAPQLEVLKYCQVMITHGGINSMLECIEHTVPMLVYPLNDDWDQNGNSARVLYYGLGLRGRIGKAKSEQLELQLEELITNSRFRHRLLEMREKINHEKEDEQRALELIHSMSSTKQKSLTGIS